MSAKHRLPIEDLQPGDHALGARAVVYLSRALRLRPGDELEVFDPRRGTRARARVIDGATVRVESPLLFEPPMASIAIVQGLPKADKLAAIVRDATELGASWIVPAACARSVVKLSASHGSARVERLRSVAIEAARQCDRTRAPEVIDPLDWVDALAAASTQASQRFVLWERATDLLGAQLRTANQASGVAFAIGPEGGLTDDEVAHARSEGWQIASLGATILRTETVAAAVLGAWRIWLG